MCEYCEKSKILIEDDDIRCFSWEPIDSINIKIIIDRGYLRMIEDDDGECLDHGEKVKINYCPMCGKPISNMI